MSPYLSGLLMCGPKLDLAQYLGLQGRQWLGSDAAARRDLLTRVQALLPVHVVLPEVRRCRLNR
jgi:hypothetical protein